MNSKIEVNIEDIKKAVYFITNLTQMQGDRPMQGALSSKADFMGGIFDRWINIIPESVIFDKIILPKIANKRDVKVITDYYDYNPKQVGIAPDVIGIMVDKRAIPFVKFDEGWYPVKETPQIEVKTFKKSQKMVSLRNQRYDDKYLVLAETDFRVDYLVPLINKEIFSEDIYNELYMNDSIFIVSNKNELIAQPRKINIERQDIGTIDLLGITTAKEFMDISTHCLSGVSVEYFSGVEINQSKRNITTSVGRLKDYCSINSNGLLKLKDNWYDRVDSEGMSYRDSKKTRALDFFVSNIDSIEILKKCKGKLIIKAHGDCIWEDTKLEAGKIYNINIKTLDRSSSSGDEYFLLKTAITNLKSYEEKLLNELEQIVENN